MDNIQNQIVVAPFLRTTTVGFSLPSAAEFLTAWLDFHFTYAPKITIKIRKRGLYRL